MYLKNQKKYNGAYGENFKNSLNCHNFCCVQDRVVIFLFYGMVFGVGLINGDIYIYPPD